MAGVHPVIYEADQEEEEAGDGAVSEHLQRGACEAHFIQRGNPQEHESHVADTAVRHEPLRSVCWNVTKAPYRMLTTPRAASQIPSLSVTSGKRLMEIRRMP